jgi:hypothetical protein
MSDAKVAAEFPDWQNAAQMLEGDGYSHAPQVIRDMAARIAADAAEIKRLRGALVAMTSHAALFNRDTDDIWVAVRDQARFALGGRDE